ncbi:MAG: S8 family serine peptidase [Actinomycetia bacterium]|nr:S8 family serine peptidase [Actinomycetes bacterium]
MAEQPDVYGPVVVGRGTDYGMELSVSDPFVYAVGFENALTPEEALGEMGALPGEWSPRGLAYSESPPSRIEHRFESSGATDAITPATLAEIVAAEDNQIRYVVPVYRSEEFGLTEFTPVPNHVVVTVMDSSVLEEIDAEARDQGFFPVYYRDRNVGEFFLRIYSSLISEPAEAPAEEFTDYKGEPGPALWLIDRLTSLDILRNAGLEAEPDWYIAYPNDLGSDASRTVERLADSHEPLPDVAMDESAVKVAVLDGEFDLNHASTKLPFGHPRRNVMENTDQVDVVNDHAHGTLCAGLIGARSGIDGWEEGGVVPTANLLPVSIYRTKEPIRAELGFLVAGINYAAEQRCKIISISVGGFPSARTLTKAVSDADDDGSLIIAGTGNRRSGDHDGAGFVLYPARYGKVIAVGAAMVDVSDSLGPLRRVSVHTSQAASESVPWESRYGKGLDVVAPGLCVTSTDISAEDGESHDVSPVGDIWNRFSGTSAATPLVAGFAAKIASQTGGSPQQIRDAIRDAAVRLGQYKYVRTRLERPWDWKVGFGWIDRTIIDEWVPDGDTPPEEPHDPEEDIPMTDPTEDTTDPEFECMPGELLVDIVGDEATYLGKFSNAVQPLADFLAALASTDDYCSVMTAHFWRDPYRTARVAGLPWDAAILLGGGNWQAVYEAVDVELHQVQNTGGAGPIWVRVD